MGKILHVHMVPTKVETSDTVYECDCGKRFVSRWVPVSDFMQAKKWIPLRWYHFKAHNDLRILRKNGKLK